MVQGGVAIYSRLIQNFAHSSRTGRYSVAGGKLGTKHRNQPVAMTGNSGKRKRLMLQEKLEAFRMLESGSIPSAVMYAFYQGRTYGMNGMAQGYGPHMLDVFNIAKLSWNNVSGMTIARCWVKANCLPTAMNAEIRAT